MERGNVIRTWAVAKAAADHLVLLGEHRSRSRSRSLDEAEAKTKNGWMG